MKLVNCCSFAVAAIWEEEADAILRPMMTARGTSLTLATAALQVTTILHNIFQCKSCIIVSVSIRPFFPRNQT